MVHDAFVGNEKNKVFFLNFADVLNPLNALSGGELVLIGSSPSVGKTWFALNIIKTMANQYKKSSCLFSIEMSKEALEKRFSLMDFDINNNQFYLIDNPNIGLSDIKDTIIRKKQSDVKLFFIDYLSLIKNENIETVVKELKTFAAEENVIIIGLLQLKRKSNNPKPEITDFQALDIYSNIVIGLYHVENSSNKSTKETEILILKNSNNSPLVRNIDLPDHLPLFDLPKNFESAELYLCHLANEGLSKRYSKEQEEYGNKWEEIKKRLDYELTTIIKMDFSNYFLIVADYVNWAKNNGIPVGTGRGSSVGSIVSYVLGITDVDPIKYNLLFERFINSELNIMPDFDNDFGCERRDEVIKYITKKYGNERVGKIEFNAGKGNLNNNLIHAAGIVINREDLSKIVPTYKDPKTDETVIKCNLDQLENHGLIKFDILGLKFLDVIKYTETQIQKKYNEYSNFSINNIPDNDSATFNLFSEGNTDNVFLHESEGMKDVLKQIKPSNMNELIAINSLYRPGLMQYIPQYIEGKKSQENINYLHPSIVEILKETYGVIIYQEQIMQIIHRITGLSIEQADIMRRVLTKKKEELYAEQKNIFINNAVKNCISVEKAKEIFDIILLLSSISFNKSHSVAYTQIAYQTAYLKTNFLEEFYEANKRYNIPEEI